MKKLLKTIYLYDLLFCLILTLNVISYNVSNKSSYPTLYNTIYEIVPFSDMLDDMNNPN